MRDRGWGQEGTKKDHAVSGRAHMTGRTLGSAYFNRLPTVHQLQYPYAYPGSGRPPAPCVPLSHVACQPLSFCVHTTLLLRALDRESASAPAWSERPGAQTGRPGRLVSRFVMLCYWRALAQGAGHVAKC